MCACVRGCGRVGARDGRAAGHRRDFEPDLFGTYIAIDPSLWWNNQALVKRAEAWLKAHRKVSVTLFLTTSDEKGIAVPTQRLCDILRMTAPAGLHWTYVPLPEEQHPTIYHPAALKAFRALFKPAN